MHAVHKHVNENNTGIQLLNRIIIRLLFLLELELKCICREKKRICHLKKYENEDDVLSSSPII